ncbi:MAG: hypothetical protein NT069_06370, partial [Planctomycetota bacterium]|nr:hypothetical protein [Planctomycetota bacterium]
MAAAARHDARRSARAIFRERSRGVFVSLAFGLICWMGLQPADCGAGDQSQPIPVVVPARDTVV